MFALNKETPKTDTHTHTYSCWETAPIVAPLYAVLLRPKAEASNQRLRCGRPKQKKNTEPSRGDARRVESSRAEQLSWARWQRRRQRRRQGQRQWLRQRNRQRQCLAYGACIFFHTFFCFSCCCYSRYTPLFFQAPLVAKSPPIFVTRAQHPGLASGAGRGGRGEGVGLLLVCASANTNKAQRMGKRP